MARVWHKDPWIALESHRMIQDKWKHTNTHQLMLKSSREYFGKALGWQSEISGDLWQHFNALTELQDKEVLRRRRISGTWPKSSDIYKSNFFFFSEDYSCHWSTKAKCQNCTASSGFMLASESLVLSHFTWCAPVVTYTRVCVCSSCMCVCLSTEGNTIKSNITFSYKNVYSSSK